MDLYNSVPRSILVILIKH